MDDQAVTANSGFCESTADFRSEVRENYLLAGKTDQGVSVGIGRGVSSGGRTGGSR